MHASPMLGFVKAHPWVWFKMQNVDHCFRHFGPPAEVKILQLEKRLLIPSGNLLHSY